jgi:hypothetical protein
VGLPQEPDSAPSGNGRQLDPVLRTDPSTET